jgi:hypothetical protein
MQVDGNRRQDKRWDEAEHELQWMGVGGRNATRRNPFVVNAVDVLVQKGNVSRTVGVKEDQFGQQWACGKSQQRVQSEEFLRVHIDAPTYPERLHCDEDRWYEEEVHPHCCVEALMIQLPIDRPRDTVLHWVEEEITQEPECDAAPVDEEATYKWPDNKRVEEGVVCSQRVQEWVRRLCALVPHRTKYRDRDTKSNEILLFSSRAVRDELMTIYLVILLPWYIFTPTSEPLSLLSDIARVAPSLTQPTL